MQNRSLIDWAWVVANLPKVLLGAVTIAGIVYLMTMVSGFVGTMVFCWIISSILNINVFKDPNEYDANFYRFTMALLSLTLMLLLLVINGIIYGFPEYVSDMSPWVLLGTWFVAQLTITWYGMGWDKTLYEKFKHDPQD